MGCVSTSVLLLYIRELNVLGLIIDDVKQIIAASRISLQNPIFNLNIMVIPCVGV